jgi:hypothetical protein
LRTIKKKSFLHFFLLVNQSNDISPDMFMNSGWVIQMFDVLQRM